MSLRAWTTIVVVAAVLIAGSLYFLVSSGSARPTTYADIGTVLGGGRIERPEEGYAITLPDGWRAWEPSADFQDWWGAPQVVSLWAEPAAVDDTWWMAACDIGDDCTRERMVAAGGRAYCWMVDDTDVAAEDGWRDVAVPAARTAASLAGDEGWTGVSTDVVDVPAGEASIVSAVDPNGWGQVVVHLNEGRRWLRLLCGLLETDLDPHSIAGSIEFLPR